MDRYSVHDTTLAVALCAQKYVDPQTVFILQLSAVPELCAPLAVSNAD